MTAQPNEALAPEVVAHVAATSHKVLLHGQEVAYWQRPGTGPTILLVHGVGASSITWDSVIDDLGQRGAEIIAVDLPGHGQSSKPRGDYSLGALASILRDLLDYLGRDTVVLVGHSLGGGIALQFIYQFPTRVERLVLVSSGGLGRETFPLLRAATLPGANIVLTVLGNSVFIKFFEFLGKFLGRFGLHPEALAPETVDTLHEFASPEGRRAFLATLRAVVDISGQKVSAVSKLSAAAHVPTLLIWGDRDPIIPIAHGENAHSLIADSRFEVFEGAGHEPHRFDTARFASLVAEFAAGDVPKA